MPIPIGILNCTQSVLPSVFIKIHVSEQQTIYSDFLQSTFTNLQDVLLKLYETHRKKL